MEKDSFSMASSRSAPSNSSLFLLISFLLASVITASSHGSKVKLTHLHFYFHEIYSGPNATATTVAVPPGTNFTFATFGSITVTDDILRKGPKPSSTPIGRAQGIAAQASLQGVELFTALNYVFTAGKFNGSTLAIMGRVVVSDPPPIERSIVGGSGKFRMARGYTLSRVITPAPADNYLLLEVDAYVLH